jgi:DNA replication protein DnaC
MLNHPTLDKLEQLRFRGMHKALRQQMNDPASKKMEFMERLGLLVDREMTERENQKLESRLRRAHLRQQVCVEDIDYRTERALERSVIQRLSTCDWIKRHHNLIVTGPTGVGKSFIACALAHKACLEGYRALYKRLPRLLDDLEVARGDGRYLRLLGQLRKVDVLVLDDWGLTRLKPLQQRDLLELLDDRHQTRSTIATSQLSISHWHETMSDPTLADAILDRLIHNAHRIELDGDSMRKRLSDLQEKPEVST